MDYVGTRLAIYAATGCENEPVNSKPLADVSQSKNTSIVATVCKAYIEVASGIPDEPGYPYHSITAPKMRQYLISVRNIDLQATEVRMILEWTQAVVAEPERINRYNLDSLADQMDTQGTS
jgi:hypothetical protein